MPTWRTSASSSSKFFPPMCSRKSVCILHVAGACGSLRQRKHLRAFAAANTHGRVRAVVRVHLYPCVLRACMRALACVRAAHHSCPSLHVTDLSTTPRTSDCRIAANRCNAAHPVATSAPRCNAAWSAVGRANRLAELAHGPFALEQAGGCLDDVAAVHASARL
jgi:hypothetical protein